MDVAEKLVRIAENAKADKDTIKQKNDKLQELNLTITDLKTQDTFAKDEATQLVAEQDAYILDDHDITGGSDTYGLVKVARQRNPLVYEAGINNGIEQGEQSAYDKFWDTLQVNGTLTDYRGVFAGASWTPELFNPKYPIRPKYAQHMFYNFCRHDNSKYFELIDLSKWNIDFSECKAFNSVFQNARIKNTGFIDFSAATSLDRVFDCSDWGSIEKISLKVVEKNTYTIPFYYCSDTKEIIFSDDSVIANNGLSFQWSSKLNKDSIISIFNALSPTKTGLSITLSKSAVNTAFGINVDDETTYPEGSEYYILRHSKDNWTISYI